VKYGLITLMLASLWFIPVLIVYFQAGNTE